MAVGEHSRTLIWHQGQHPYKHPASDFAYTHQSMPGVATLEAALNWVLAVLYPNAKAAVATVAALPAVGNTINDYRVVLDDGDGKAASYRWEQREGDAVAKWYKVLDMDWGYDSILSQTLDRTNFLYVHKAGYDDLDSAGAAITGTYAGQKIYGGKSASTNLTLAANSGDGTGAHTGYIQVDDHFRPATDSTWTLGTTTERWLKIWTDEITVNTMTVTTGQILDSTGAISFGDENISTTGYATIGTTLKIEGAKISDSTGAISFDNEDLTTTGSLTANHIHATGAVSELKSGTTIGTLTLADGSIKDSSGAISFDNENLSTSGDITGGKGVFDNITIDGDTISSTNTNGNIVFDPNGSGKVTVTGHNVEVTDAYLKVSGTGGLLDVDNLRLDGNTLSSTDTNGEVVIDPNGVGLIQLGAAIYPTTDSSWDIGKTSYVWNKLWIDGSIGGATQEILITELMALRNILFQDATRMTAVTAGCTLFWDAVSSTFLASIPDTEIHHGALTGLGDDDHTIYPLLAGRAGGQTITGGTAASDDLTLESTSNGTKGNVFFSSILAPTTDKLIDIGDATHYIHDLYIYGELCGARLQNFTTVGRPAAATATKGRLIWDTDLEDIFVDQGAAWLQIMTDRWFLQDATSWTGAVTSVAYTVDGSVEPTRGRVSDARMCLWALYDNSNNFEEVICEIQKTQTTVTVVVDVALPAGTYTLKGVG